MDKAEYLRWSCDKLWSLLEGQYARLARARTLAGGGIVLLASLVAVGGRWIPSASTPCEVIAVAVGGSAAALALVFWYRTLRVLDLAAVNTRAFIDDEGTQAEDDYPARLARVRDNLIAAVSESKEGINRAVEMRGFSLLGTVIAVLAFGLIPFIRLLERILQ